MNLKDNGVLGQISAESGIASIYAIFFVVLSLVFDKQITSDKLALPALVLYGIAFAVRFYYKKQKAQTLPRSVFVLLVAMTILLATIITFI